MGRIGDVDVVSIGDASTDEARDVLDLGYVELAVDHGGGHGHLLEPVSCRRVGLSIEIGMLGPLTGEDPAQHLHG